ncbi:thioesterase II family protein [Embleya sp. NPDC056575]|uniref:thioesterase II family protein n=1 Tax=unclassified Embleya TaxID=2699296 RepID=UPI0036756B4A
MESICRPLGTRSPRPDLVTYTPRPHAPVRMFTIPYAGADATMFAPWVDYLPDSVEVTAVRLPGRGARTGEVSLTDPAQLSAMVAELVLESDDGRPYVFFGHSIGAMIAFDTVRELRRCGHRMPSLLALSAVPPPQGGAFARACQPILVSDQPWRQLGLTDLLPPEVFRDQGSMAAFGPPMMADLLLALQHRYVHEAPLDCVLSVFGARDDTLVAVESLSNWQEQTTRPLRLRTYPGGHLYVHEALPSLLTDLSTDLRSTVGAFS